MANIWVRIAIFSAKGRNYIKDIRKMCIFAPKANYALRKIGFKKSLKSAVVTLQGFKLMLSIKQLERLCKTSVKQTLSSCTSDPI